MAEQLDIQCGNGEIIAVESARYGRMRLGRCVRTDYGYIGCSTDVTDVLTGRCSGRRRCQVVNIELMLIEVLFAACPGDLASYLEVNYSCIRGRSVSSAVGLLVTNLKTCKVLLFFSTVLRSDRRSGSDRRSEPNPNPISNPNPNPNPSRSEPINFSFNSLLSFRSPI